MVEFLEPVVNHLVLCLSEHKFYIKKHVMEIYVKSLFLNASSAYIS